jgi:hypothetical protein
LQFDSHVPKILQIQREGLYLSNEMFHAGFGFMVEELQGFLDFSLSSGMLSTSSHAAEPAQTAHLNMGQGGAGW